MTTPNPEGTVLEALPNGEFLVQLPDRINRCYTSGKMRLHKIKVLVGDRVEVFIPDYGEIGRIIRRR